jgi:hypothetical protein
MEIFSRLRWAVHVERIVKMWNTYFSGKPVGRDLLEDLVDRDNIKIDLRDLRFEGVYWIYLVRKGDLVVWENTEMARRGLRFEGVDWTHLA